MLCVHRTYGFKSRGWLTSDYGCVIGGEMTHYALVSATYCFCRIKDIKEFQCKEESINSSVLHTIIGTCGVV